MDTHETAWATIQAWTGGVDECGLAAYRDLAMARAPLRRLSGAALPAPAVLPGTGADLLGRDESRRRGRPGRRW
jgi:hypothetical protein